MSLKKNDSAASKRARAEKLMRECQFELSQAELEGGVDPATGDLEIRRVPRVVKPVFRPC